MKYLFQLLLLVVVIAAALADVVQKQPLPLPQPAVNKHGAQGTLTGQPSQVKPQPLPAKRPNRDTPAVPVQKPIPAPIKPVDKTKDVPKNQAHKN